MKSFLQGKKNLSVAGLRPPSASTGSPAPAGALVRPANPMPAVSAAHVEVVKEGDKVVRLVVTCVCGERVEIECLYPAGS